MQIIKLVPCAGFEPTRNLYRSCNYTIVPCRHLLSKILIDRQILSVLRILRFADSQDLANLESESKYLHRPNPNLNPNLNFQEKPESRISNPNLSIYKHRIRILDPNLKNHPNLPGSEFKVTICRT